MCTMSIMSQYGNTRCKNDPDKWFIFRTDRNALGVIKWLPKTEIEFFIAFLLKYKISTVPMINLYAPCRLQ